jgi:hypothetical protein
MPVPGVKGTISLRGVDDDIMDVSVEAVVWALAEPIFNKPTAVNATVNMSALRCNSAL